MQYKVLVVEDESPILNNIVRKVNGLDLPLTVVATAVDGEEALELIALHQPQMVLTDIRMAGMDGLTLCSKIDKAYPHIKTVVISGYGEFEYARKAIQYHVNDYLLKPVNIDRLRETMRALCDALEQETEQQKRQILMRHLTGTAEENDLPCQFAEETFGVYLICLGSLLEHTHGDADAPFYNALWKRAAISELLESFLPKRDNWWLIGEKYPNEQILITTAFSPNRDGTLYRAVCARLEDCASVTVCGYPRAVSYRDLWKIAQQLRHMLHKSLIPCVSCFFSFDNPPVFAEDPADALLQLVLRTVQNRQPSQYKAALGTYFAALQESGAPQQYLEQGVQSILKAVGESCGAAQAAADGFCRLIVEQTSADALYAALTARLEEVFVGSLPACDSGEGLARTVKKYLEENYQQDISINTLTDIFHFSASYIGRVFRTQYGVPPVKYLLQLRMQKAKELLSEHTDVSVALIAQTVGYEDAHYFSRIFRATVGVSPSEYKESL